MTLTKDNYYETKMLSVSIVRQFAQNPKRALDSYNGKFPFFDEKTTALPLGTAFHDMLENAINLAKDKEFIDSLPKDDTDWILNGLSLIEQKAIDIIFEQMQNEPKYNNIRTKKGLLTADAKRVPEWFKLLWNSEPMKNIALKAILSTNNNAISVHTEMPFVSTYHGTFDEIKYKGRIDLYIVDKKKKIIDAYDYKTSKPFDPSGIDWGTDIDGNHTRMPVEWTVEKLFPWQAGVYRHLLQDNGYQDYTVKYHYLVITKEKTPRLTIFNISSESMDEGYSQFCDWLVKANEYIKGNIEAPLIQDGSQYANQQTHSSPIEITSHPYDAS